MGQSISPISYRLGFFRVWDSLYTNKLYFRNFNYYIKSQMICLYIEGFFKRWTWNGKRSFYLNYLFSHIELSWSFSFLHMNIFVYNTGFQYSLFKLHKLLKRNFGMNYVKRKEEEVDLTFFLKKKSIENKFNKKFVKRLNYKLILKQNYLGGLKNFYFFNNFFFYLQNYIISILDLQINLKKNMVMKIY